MLREEVTVISPTTDEEPQATLGPAVDGLLPTVVTGPGALGLWAEAVAVGDLALVVWDGPDEPMLLFAGDDAETGRRLQAGTIVVVATPGVGIDPILTLAGLADSDSASSWFGAPVVVSPEDPRRAATVLAGTDDRAAAVLSTAGASVTILVRAGSELAPVLERSNVAPSACLTVAEDGGGLAAALRGLAWSGSPQTVQIRIATSTDVTASVAGASDVAFVSSGAAARRRAADLLDGKGPIFDLVVAAEPGERSSARVDLAVLASEVGTLAVTGSGAPSGETIVLGGEAAGAVRQRLAIEPGSVGRPATIRASTAEDAGRYEAHQWASSMYRAARLRGNGAAEGTALGTEADSAGLIGPKRSGRGVDGRTLARIARARGWHVIDPELPPLLDPILEMARQQAAGSDEPMDPALVQRLAELGSRPGFWSNLVSAVRPPSGRNLVFPYPAPAVEILRAAAASGGDAAKLRSWLGPVKVAIYRSFSGGSR
jgi:hypothetical protein